MVHEEGLLAIWLNAEWDADKIILPFASLLFY